MAYSLGGVEKIMNLELYFEYMEEVIRTILQRPQKCELTYDLLDNSWSKEVKLLSLKLKQLQMKRGEI